MKTRKLSISVLLVIGTIVTAFGQRIEEGYEFFMPRSYQQILTDKNYNDTSELILKNPYFNFVATDSALMDYYLQPSVMYTMDSLTDTCCHCWTLWQVFEIIDSNTQVVLLTDTLFLQTSDPVTLEHVDTLKIPHNGETYILRFLEDSVQFCGTDSVLPLDIRFEFRFIAQRRELLSKSDIPSITTGSAVDPQCELIQWQLLANAAYYELEYAFYDSYETVPTQNIFDRAIRIETHNNFYCIQRIYPDGELHVRVRAVNFFQDIGYEDQIMPASWSDPIAIPISGFEPTLNWSTEVNFAEEGKSKRTVSYYDYSLRPRQNVVDLKSENYLLVDELDYDAEGKEVLKILPAPRSTEGLDYRFNDAFNINATSDSYSYLDFDKSSAAQLFNSSGAGLYYSSTNNLNTIHRDYIPDAEGFPLLHKKYKRDFRGFVDAQGNSGVKLQLGTGRETKYAYLSVGDAEIQRLFGKENIGKSSHYKKQITIDPNGQGSVTYQDMYDKTVATALIGASPSNVVALDFSSTSLSNSLETGEVIQNKIVSSNTLFNDGAAQNYQFHYEIEELMVEFESGKCLDCNYCITFNIVDDCGDPITISNVISGIQYDIHPDGSLSVYVGDKSEKTCDPNIGIGAISFEASIPALSEFTINKCLEFKPYTADELWDYAIATLDVEDYYESIRSEVEKKYPIHPCFPTCHAYCDYLIKEEFPGLHITNPDLFDEYVRGCKDTACYQFTEPVAGQGSPCDRYIHEIHEQLNPNSASAVLLNTAAYESEIVDKALIHFYDQDGIQYSYDGNNGTAIITNLETLEEYNPIDVTLNCNGSPITFTLPADITNMITSSGCWQSNWAEDIESFHRDYDCYQKCLYLDKSAAFSQELTTLESLEHTHERYNYFCTTCDKMEFLTYLVNQKDPLFNDPDIKTNFGEYCGTDPLKAKMLDWLNNYTDLIDNGPQISLHYLSGSKDIITYVDFIVETAFYFNPQTGLDKENEKWKSLLTSYISLKERIFWDCMDCNAETSDPRVFSKPIQLRHDVSLEDLKKYAYDTLAGEWTGNTCGGMAENWVKFFEEEQGVTLGTQDRQDLLGHLEYHCGQACPLRLGECQNTNPSTPTLWCPVLGQDPVINIPFQYDAHYSGQATLFAPFPTNVFQPQHMNVPQNVAYHFLAGLHQSIFQTSMPYTIRVSALNDFCSAPGNGFLEDKLKIAIYHTDCNGVQIFNYGQLNADSYVNYFNSTILEITVPPVQSQSYVIQFYVTDPAMANVNFSFEIIAPYQYQTSKMQRFTTTGANFSHFSGLKNSYDKLKGLGYTDQQVMPFIINSWNCTPSCKTIEPCYDIFFQDMINAVHNANYINCFSSPITNPQSCFNTFTYNWCNLEDNYITEFIIPLQNEDLVFRLLEQDGGFVNLENTFIIDYVTTDEHLDYFDRSSIAYPSNGSKSFMAEVKFLLMTQSGGQTYFHEAYGHFMTKDMQYNFPVTSDKDCGKDIPSDLCLKCKEDNQRKIDEQAEEEFKRRVRKKVDDFFANQDLCLDDQDEEFWTDYLTSQYHYTLYYHDQVGNVIQTIPPEGVVPLPASDFSKGKQINNNTPQHKINYATTYQYNSYNLPTITKSSDGGTTTMHYDKINRLRLTQHANQTVSHQYNYTKYDPLNREIETGEVENYFILNQDDLDDPDFPDASYIRNDIINTNYTLPYSGLGFAGVQDNLRGKVSWRQFNDVVHVYNYDVHGNVMDFYQYQPGIEWKTLGYDYDLISGLVKKLNYQLGEDDHFEMRYLYDRDNRLTHTYSSRDGLLWDEDARYFYYMHGPLARVEYGNEKVQGLDYMYTIQGWIKGINAMGTGVFSHDPGTDGLSGPIHSNLYTGRDIAGYHLGYFKDDYKPIGGISKLSPILQNTWNQMSGDILQNGLYNGNIAWMMTSLSAYHNGELTPTDYQGILTNAYQHDQLHRIRYSLTYGSSDGNNLVNHGTANSRDETFTYDANGNLKTLTRNAPGLNLIDDLTYFYNTGSQQPNTLAGITDATYKPDISQVVHTGYMYDPSGNLVKENLNNNVSWDIYFKISSVNFSGMEWTNYLYDPMGNKATQDEYTSGGNVLNTYRYVRDPQGQLLAIYRQQTGTSGTILPRVEEFQLYGSDHIGVRFTDDATRAEPMKRFRQRSNYFVKNHLGNVLAKVSDYRIGVYDYTIPGFHHYEAENVRSQDYYAFGTVQRELVNTAAVHKEVDRFAFNSKEKSHATGPVTNYDYGFRIYNSGIGRFLSTDPLADKYPYYTPYQFAGNMPIQATDLDGLEPKKETGESATENRPARDNLSAYDVLGYGQGLENEKFKKFTSNTSNTLITNITIGGNPCNDCVDPTSGQSTETSFIGGQMITRETQSFASQGLTNPTEDPITLGLGGAARSGFGLRAMAFSTDVSAKTNTKVVGNTLKGFTKHGLNQSINRGFKSGDILKIMREGKAVPATGRYGSQTRYTFGGNTVVTNAQGNVVTTFSNAEKGLFIPFK